MKESKSFFDNNRLNKGYGKVSNVKQSDSSFIRKKYRHVLPPLDMMEEYEELNPGTFERLFDMAEKEQNHRHSMDLLVIEKYNRATRLGRVFALVFIALISTTTLMLVIVKSSLSAAIFAVSAFACITIVSYLYSKRHPYKNSTSVHSSKHKHPRHNRAHNKNLER